MKYIIFASVFFLALSQKVVAQEVQSIATMLTEGDHQLMIFDTETQTFSVEALDSEGLIVPGPGGGHGGGGHGGGGHGGGTGGGHGGGGHGGGGHGGGGWHGGTWHPYPGWHNGWAWNRGWHPGWWRVGIIWPVWVWMPGPAPYWQCTAFNSNLQGFSAVGPDINQAAYGALYACGGPNYEQMGCYIPEGYCQLRR